VRIKIENTVDYIIYFIPNYIKKQEKIRKGLTLKIKTSLSITGPLTQSHQPIIKNSVLSNFLSNPILPYPLMQRPINVYVKINLYMLKPNIMKY
jgi:hypothetical protein